MTPKDHEIAKRFKERLSAVVSLIGKLGTLPIYAKIKGASLIKKRRNSLIP